MSILYSVNGHFLTLLLISPQQMMVERQTIPHINALLSGSKILGEKLSSSFRGCHATSSLKSVIFTRKVAWSSLIELQSCSWHILTPTSRPFKWGIICLSSISGSLSNSLFTKYSNPPNQYIRSAVYHWFCGLVERQKFWVQIPFKCRIKMVSKSLNGSNFGSTTTLTTNISLISLGTYLHTYSIFLKKKGNVQR